jgi:hypothetical protein
MPENHDSLNNIVYSTQPLGCIVYDVKANGVYAKHLKYYTDGDGILQRRQDYLGKVIDKDSGLLYNKDRGYFYFSIENGIESASIECDPKVFKVPQHVTLGFGDVWMVDQILKQTGLDNVLDNLVPNERDTLKSLVSFRVLEAEPYSYISSWYNKSYAKILYPEAKVDSPRISEFHVTLGSDLIYKQFFDLYLDIISNNSAFNNKLAVPILLDSTGLPNDIKTHLTAVNNHNGVINNEIRLIYVVDKNTKLPIFFRYVSGNIIDNSTLINTVNMLSAYNLNIELIIMDAGYYSVNNLIQLISSNISFITRITKNRCEYKNLMLEHGSNLENWTNVLTYGIRTLYGKKVPISLYGKELFAYIMLDTYKKHDEISKFILNNEHSSNYEEKYNDVVNSAGKFILLSSDEYDIKQILPLYYTRQQIEQVFDLNKTYAALLPLRCHSEETLRGVLLISFITAIILSALNNKLTSSKFCSHKAIYDLHRLNVTMYESSTIIEELTKNQKEIFSLLQLDCPFIIEKGNRLQKQPLRSNLKVEGKKRGRPKGSKNKVKLNLPVNTIYNPINKQNNVNNIQVRPKGRPKGSKNRPK